MQRAHSYLFIMPPLGDYFILLFISLYCTHYYIVTFDRVVSWSIISFCGCIVALLCFVSYDSFAQLRSNMFRIVLQFRNNWIQPHRSNNECYGWIFLPLGWFIPQTKMSSVSVTVSITVSVTVSDWHPFACLYHFHSLSSWEQPGYFRH